MRLNRAAAGIATVAIASAAIVSGCGVTHQGAVPVTRPAQHQASAHPVSTHRAQLTAVQRPASTDPSLAWLESAGGQAQVTFNNEVDTLAADLQTEAHAPTVANHLVFEADARAVRAQASEIIRTPALPASPGPARRPSQPPCSTRRPPAWAGQKPARSSAPRPCCRPITRLPT